MAIPGVFVLALNVEVNGPGYAIVYGWTEPLFSWCTTGLLAWLLVREDDILILSNGMEQRTSFLWRKVLESFHILFLHPTSQRLVTTLNSKAAIEM